MVGDLVCGRGVFVFVGENGVAVLGGCDGEGEGGISVAVGEMGEGSGDAGVSALIVLWGEGVFGGVSAWVFVDSFPGFPAV